MFTGIITDVGEIAALDTRGDWIADITASSILPGLVIGGSVSCNGICLTVIALLDGAFRVQISTETLDKTTARRWRVGTLINLERALRMGDELGGHLVSGHVDGVVRVAERHDEKDSIRFRFHIPEAFTPYVAPKGSIALDGISLTINEVEGDIFGVNIIPHTQEETTICERKVGDILNFEIDLFARYVGQILEKRGLISG